MARKEFALGGHGFLGELSFDIQEISGDGGGAYPFLTIPINLVLKPALSPSRDAPGKVPKMVRPITLIHMTGTLWFREGPRIADMSPQVVSHHSYMAETGVRQSYYLIFPLDAHRISIIEEKRRGGDLGLRLYLSFLAAFHAEVPIGADPAATPPVNTFTTSTEALELVIPQSQWARAILPKLGHGDRVVMELPLPAPEKRERMEGAVQHLQQAWAAFRRGNDPEVLRICHLLWERLIQDFRAGDQPDQNAFSQLLEMIGIDSAKRDSLHRLCDYLARFNHLGRHERQPPVPLDHRDAEFALLATQTVLVYLARLM